ncbi:phytanoyl-CoA dioxygenase family protein [Streptomyces sp. NPDC059766]|uniref:phytanoyl-CoA dioxygenase family protein n=1 Tax=Streptomyces sp. NPDC059766 TaxID=3346940 RepID=UPI00366882C1
MKSLNVNNDLLGDREALDRTLDEQGYLFFKGVIDLDAIAKVQTRMRTALAEDYGLSAADQELPVWNGNDLSVLPNKAPQLYKKGIWQEFTSTLTVNGFFEKVAGEEITWIPISEYRMTVPLKEVPADFHFRARHQDGFFNPGIDFRTCWFPLTRIDDKVGGLALVPGYHKQGYLHDHGVAPKFEIPDGIIPDEAWARPEVYEPGDVVVFTGTTPHMGLPNVSDQFRMSMDLRFVPASRPQPVAGVLEHVDGTNVTITTEDGQVTLALEDDTYIRKQDGNLVPRKDAGVAMQPGELVLAGRSGGTALGLRPQHG